MNKSDLVDGIAAATNESKTKVAALLDAALASISGALQKGDRVTLPGFGTFSTRRREARSGRNPRTGAPVKIAATTAPVFKAGVTLKDAVANAGKAGSRAKAASKAKTAAKAGAKAPAKASAKAKAAKPAAKSAAKAKPARAAAKATPKAKGGAKAKAKSAAKKK
jgi:DNA-binding protein HU-beta